MEELLYDAYDIPELLLVNEELKENDVIRMCNDLIQDRNKCAIEEEEEDWIDIKEARTVGEATRKLKEFDTKIVARNGLHDDNIKIVIDRTYNVNSSWKAIMFNKDSKTFLDVNFKPLLVEDIRVVLQVKVTELTTNDTPTSNITSTIIDTPTSNITSTIIDTGCTIKHSLEGFSKLLASNSLKLKGEKLELKYLEVL